MAKPIRHMFDTEGRMKGREKEMRSYGFSAGTSRKTAEIEARRSVKWIKKNVGLN